MSYWQGRVAIGSFSFPRFIGGPLDGITDSPFRKLVRDFSKDELLYTEMRHVACIGHEKGGQRALKFEQMERPLNYQVAANKVEYIASACEKILQAGVDIVDLNIGCPARNVVSSGSGSAMMADLKRLESILVELRRCLPIPFTVKIRAGFKEQNAVDVAKLIQDCGADALAIHPRLQTQFFEGRPDYALAAQVKKTVSIPVILSGGIVNWRTASMAYEQTGVDAYLIGRGIWAQPWKLHELYEHSQGREFAVDRPQMIHYALKHLDYMMEYYGAQGLFNFRKHLPFYVRGIPGATDVRRELVVAQSVDEVKNGLIRLLGC